MTLRLKSMTQMDEKNVERNCTMLQSFLNGSSYKDAAKVANVTVATALSSAQRLVFVLSVYAAENGISHPYTEEHYPHLWQDVMQGVKWVRRPNFRSMLAQDLRQQSSYWLGLIDAYRAWLHAPLGKTAFTTETPVHCLDLSTNAFRNIAHALQDIHAKREPTIGDLLNVLRKYPEWNMRCQIHTGIGERAFTDILEELNRHGFTVEPPMTMSDRDLFREALAFAKQPKQYTREEQNLLIERLSKRIAS